MKHNNPSYCLDVLPPTQFLINSRELKYIFPFPPHPGNIAWQEGAEILYYSQGLCFDLRGSSKPPDQGDLSSVLG